MRRDTSVNVSRMRTINGYLSNDGYPLIDGVPSCHSTHSIEGYIRRLKDAKKQIYFFDNCEKTAPSKLKRLGQKLRINRFFHLLI